MTIIDRLFMQIISNVFRFFRKNLFFVTGILFMAGCVNGLPPYNVVIRNAGNIGFDNSYVMFNDYTLSAGWVSPGYGKTNINPEIPIPEKAIVVWERKNGASFKKEVELKKNLPPFSEGKEYNIIFQINDDENVTLKVVPCANEGPCPELYK